MAITTKTPSHSTWFVPLSTMSRLDDQSLEYTARTCSSLRMIGKAFGSQNQYANRSFTCTISDAKHFNVPEMTLLIYVCTRFNPLIYHQHASITKTWKIWKKKKSSSISLAIKKKETGFWFVKQNEGKWNKMRITPCELHFKCVMMMIMNFISIERNGKKQ